MFVPTMISQNKYEQQYLQQTAICSPMSQEELNRHRQSSWDDEHSSSMSNQAKFDMVKSLLSQTSQNQ